MSYETDTHARLVPIFDTSPDVAACTKQPASQLTSSREQVTCPDCRAKLSHTSVDEALAALHGNPWDPR